MESTAQVQISCRPFPSCQPRIRSRQKQCSCPNRSRRSHLRNLRRTLLLAGMIRRIRTVASELTLPCRKLRLARRSSWRLWPPPSSGRTGCTCCTLSPAQLMQGGHTISRDVSSDKVSSMAADLLSQLEASASAQVAPCSAFGSLAFHSVTASATLTLPFCQEQGLQSTSAPQSELKKHPSA